MSLLDSNETFLRILCVNHCERPHFPANFGATSTITYALIRTHHEQENPRETTTPRKSPPAPHKTQKNTSCHHGRPIQTPGSLSHWDYDATAAASTSEDMSSSDNAFAASLAYCLASSGVGLDGVLARRLLRMHRRVPSSPSSGWGHTSLISLSLDIIVEYSSRPGEGKWVFILLLLPLVLPELKMLRVAAIERLF